MARMNSGDAATADKLPIAKDTMSTQTLITLNRKQLLSSRPIINGTLSAPTEAKIVPASRRAAGIEEDLSGGKKSHRSYRREQMSPSDEATISASCW